MVLLDSGPYTTDRRSFSAGHFYEVQEAPKSIKNWLSETISVGTHSLQIPQPMAQSAARWIGKASEVHEKTVVAQSLNAYIPCSVTQVMDSFQTSLKSDLPRVSSVADAPTLSFSIFCAVKNDAGSNVLTVDRLIIECSPTAMAVPKIRENMALLGLRVNQDGTTSPVDFIHVKVLGTTRFSSDANDTNREAPTYDDYVNILCKGTDEQTKSMRLKLERKWKDFQTKMDNKSMDPPDYRASRFDDSNRSREYQSRNISSYESRVEVSDPKRKREYEVSTRKFEQLQIELFSGVKRLFAGTTRPYAQLASIQGAARQLAEVVPDQLLLNRFYNSLACRPVAVIDLKGIYLLDGLTATRCALVLALHCQVESEPKAAAKGRPNPPVQRNAMLEPSFVDWKEIPKDFIQQARDWIETEDPKNWSPTIPIEPRSPLMPAFSSLYRQLEFDRELREYKTQYDLWQEQESTIKEQWERLAPTRIASWESRKNRALKCCTSMAGLNSAAHG